MDECSDVARPITGRGCVLYMTTDVAYGARMIARINRWRPAVDQVAEEYQRWEQRHASRMRGWSTRRRWTVFVLLPVLLIGCGGSMWGSQTRLSWLTCESVPSSSGCQAP